MSLLDALMIKPIGPLVIPVSPGRAVTMVLPGRMNRQEWVQFHAVLEAMKPALVSEEDSDARSAG